MQVFVSEENGNRDDSKEDYSDSADTQDLF
jgi:hypothetical protein